VARRPAALAALIGLLVASDSGCRRDGEAPASGASPSGAPPVPAKDASRSKAAALLRGAGTYEVAEVPDAGALEVTAVYAGDPIPEPSRIPVATDAAHCGDKVFTENIVVDRDSRGLRNVVVRIEGITRGKPPPEKVVLEVKDCAFVPHVAATMRGVHIELQGADPIRHTVHARIHGESIFNVPLNPGAAPPTPRPAPQPGTVEIGCDVHSWMSGILVVHASPYIGVTGPGGKLEIEGIPPGTYPYVAWHEQLGEKQGEIEIPPGRTAALKLEMSAPR
jgi:hypothetical protein